MFYFGKRPILCLEAVWCMYCMCVCVCEHVCALSVHPAATKVEKVNGRLIRKLGSLHATLPSHYSSLIGGPLPKGEHNMIGSPGCIWRDGHPDRNVFCTVRCWDCIVGLTCGFLSCTWWKPSHLWHKLGLQWKQKFNENSVLPWNGASDSNIILTLWMTSLKWISKRK